jgi:general secretion pathway protein H
MNMRRTAYHASGFTLFEMLVVIGILGLISQIAFPAIERGRARNEFNAALGVLELTIVRARANAVAQSIPTLVVIGRSSAGAERNSESAAVPDKFRLELPSRPIRFFADGTSTGGSIKLLDERLFAEIFVDADTGAIAVNRQ